MRGILSNFMPVALCSSGSSNAVRTIRRRHLEHLVPMNSAYANTRRTGTTAAIESHLSTVSMSSNIASLSVCPTYLTLSCAAGSACRSRDSPSLRCSRQLGCRAEAGPRQLLRGVSRRHVNRFFLRVPQSAAAVTCRAKPISGLARLGNYMEVEATNAFDKKQAIRCCVATRSVSIVPARLHQIRARTKAKLGRVVRSLNVRA